MDKTIILNTVKNALKEDIGNADITSDSLIAKNLEIKAKIIAKEKICVVCGIELVKKVFRHLDKKCRLIFHKKDGDLIKKGAVLCTLKGNARAILKGERTALNFLGRLSGIATKTNNLVKKVKSYKIKILDTRKTAPGLRYFEKYAVKTGDGHNHRFGLFDQVLIKDNHIAIAKLADKKINLDALVKKAKKRNRIGIKTEIEVNNLKQLNTVLRAAPDIIMLDNMSLKTMKQAVMLRNKINKKIELEASGNITQDNIRKVAACGIDSISLGALTHSAANIDFSLEVIGIIK